MNISGISSNFLDFGCSKSLFHYFLPDRYVEFESYFRWFFISFLVLFKCQRIDSKSNIICLFIFNRYMTYRPSSYKGFDVMPDTDLHLLQFILSLVPLALFPLYSFPHSICIKGNHFFSLFSWEVPCQTLINRINFRYFKISGIYRFLTQLKTLKNI